MTKIRAVIAEDEPLARRKLRRLLAEFTEVEVVGETTDGPATVLALDRLQPDLVFLDIRLPGVSGLEVLRQAEHVPRVVFTTAYDRYAVAAFELHALDYLVKPFGRQRLAVAIERATESLERRVAGIPVSAGGERWPEAPLERLFVRTRGKIVPVNTGEIEHLEGEGDYVRVHVGEREHLVHVRLKDLEAWLDSARFLRVHKSHIVNLDRISEIRPHRGSRYLLIMKSGRRVVASRARSKELRKLVV